MIAVHWIIFLLLLFWTGFSEAKEVTPKFALYGTAEYFESRFVRENQKSKTNALLNTEYKNFQIGIERRGEKELGSLEFKNDLFYISLGHRYKPIPGFYILRDEKYYSAFQNPKLGVIPQPLKKSIWLGIFPTKWSGGIFMGENLSENKPSLYIKSPSDVFAYTYSPETKIHFFAMNLRGFKPNSKSEAEYTANSQMMGTRENYFGYLNLRALFPKRGIEAEFSTYRENNGMLFATNQDNLRGTDNEKSFSFKISRYHYDRLEAFQNITEEKNERIIGVNSSIFTGIKGAICISGRSYQNQILDSEKDISLLATQAVGVSYEYRLKDTEFMLRLEKRKNQDQVGELKFTIRPIPEWKFEISSILQKDSNQFRSLYEQWSDGENINTILTDRAAVFKLKVIGSFLVFNVSGSRRINGAGEIYFANIQFKQEF
ncbi:MAG: hypothetical protein KBF93_05570 [Leptospiraceae bacterium]|nr:hypothetical protein [Leptospiraceae bacterium]